MPCPLKKAVGIRMDAHGFSYLITIRQITAAER